MGIKKYKIVSADADIDYSIFEEPRFSLDLSKKLIEYINEPIDNDYLNYEETLVILNSPDWDKDLEDDEIDTETN